MSYQKQTWNSGVAGGTPISAAALNNIEAGIANADFYTCVSAAKPTTGLFDGFRVYCTDTKSFGFWDATAGTWRMIDTVTQVYTPTWYVNGVANAGAIGSGSVVGRYMRQSNFCQVRIQLTVGASGFNGGAGNWTFSAPIAATQASGATEGSMFCKAWCAGGVFTGSAYVAAGTVSVTPFLPYSISNCGQGIVRNADPSNVAVGTGIPAVSGHFTFDSQGHNLVIAGTYEI